MLIPGNEGLKFTHRVRFGNAPSIIVPVPSSSVHSSETDSVSDLSTVRAEIEYESDDSNSVAGLSDSDSNGEQDHGEDGESDYERERKLYHFIYHVLDLLHRNTLHDIQPPLPSGVPQVWYEKSFSSQQRVVAPGYHKEDVRSIVKITPGVFKGCGRLEIHPKRVADLELIHAIAARVPDIQELKVSSGWDFYNHPLFRDPREGANHVGTTALDAALFGSTLASQSIKAFPALRSLTLTPVMLEDSTEAYAKYLPFETLYHLELRACHGTAALLRNLFLDRTMQKMCGCQVSR